MAERRLRRAGAGGFLVMLAACSSASTTTNSKPVHTPTNTDTVPVQARLLAHRDHNHHYGEYAQLFRAGHRRCRADSPATVTAAVESAYQALSSYPRRDRSRLSLLRSLAAGVGHNGPIGTCTARARALVAELSRHSGGPIVGVKIRFAPPVSAGLALDAVKREVLPAGRLRVVYTLTTAAHCAETIYLSSRIEARVGSGGVMVELTSEGGVTSRYDPRLVDRAMLSVGHGALGGQSCV
jgi:hypothetical protein